MDGFIFRYLMIALPILVIVFLLYKLIQQSTTRKCHLMMEREIGSGETIVFGPQFVPTFTDARLVGTKSSGIVVITENKLLFCPHFGGPKHFMLTNITEVKKLDAFGGNFRLGYQYVVMEMNDGAEYGFQVKNGDEWADAVKSRLGH